MRCDVTIRCSAPVDWPSLCSLHDRARRDELRATALLSAYVPLEGMASNEGLHHAALYVALRDGALCGFVAYRENELTGLYVHREHYRTGIGRALLRHVLEALEGEATVEVLAGNEAALSLYFSEGFEVLRRVEMRLAGDGQAFVPGYLLQRAKKRG